MSNKAMPKWGKVPDHNDLPCSEEDPRNWLPLPKIPDQYDLPCTEENMVSNGLEHPLSMLLTDAITPYLQQRHPDNRFWIGQDVFIYYDAPESLSDGRKAPDWFCVLDVPQTVDGRLRRSYLLWRESTRPAIVLEFISDTEGGERDRTPENGKFWVYENRIRAPYYGIFDPDNASLEVYVLDGPAYRLMPPNQRGHFLIDSLGLELGLWRGTYLGIFGLWMRWSDVNGVLLPTYSERAEIEKLQGDAARLEAKAEKQRAETEKQRAEAEKQRADSEHHQAESEKQRAEVERQRAEAKQQENEKLKEKLRSLGIDPDTL